MTVEISLIILNGRAGTRRNSTMETLKEENLKRLPLFYRHGCILDFFTTSFSLLAHPLARQISFVNYKVERKRLPQRNSQPMSLDGINAKVIALPSSARQD
jgi:hypothetical protein